MNAKVKEFLIAARLANGYWQDFSEYDTETIVYLLKSKLATFGVSNESFKNIHLTQKGVIMAGSIMDDGYDKSVQTADMYRGYAR